MSEVLEWSKDRDIYWDRWADIAMFSNFRGLLEEVVDSNPSANLPYHNNHHMKAVAIRSMELLRQQCQFEGLKPYATTVQRLFIAASLHDWGHSGGRLKDVDNIATAVQQIQVRFDGVLPQDEVDEIVKLVQVTEYPFVHEPTSLIARCLRDADLLMFLEPDAVMFRRGLSIEMSLVEPYTAEQIMEFINQQTFYTDAAIQLIRKYNNVEVN